jgi:hypothetical protein
MKEIVLLLGLSVGFVLGSRSGRGPYEQLERKLRSFSRRDDVRGTVTQLRDAAKDQANAVADNVTDKLAGSESAR